MSRSAGDKAAPASDQIKFDFFADQRAQTVTIAITKGGKLYGTCYLTPDEAGRMARSLLAMRDKVIGTAATTG